VKKHNTVYGQSQAKQVPLGEAERIVHALGGRNGMAPCPAHDDEKPSLSVTEKNGRLLVHCHAGCSQVQVIDALRRLGQWPEAKPKKRLAQRSDIDEGLLDYEKFKRAFILLRAAAGCEQSPGKYLQSRGIEEVPENLLLIDPQTAKRLLGKRFPAMVAPVIREDRLVGAHVTLLNKDGDAKLKSKDSVKKMYGPVKGGYVQLGEVDPDKRLKTLVVAEGIETALSVRQITGLPVLAALSASNMSNVILPKAKEIIIAADNDQPGIEAAEKLADRLLQQGFRRVRIAAPEVEGTDWNDVLRGETDLEALKNSILKSPRSADTGIRALTTEELLALPVSPMQHMMAPWLPVGALTMIHGKRGGGKTWFAMSVAYAVATGRELLGWEVEQSRRVLYVDGEMGKARLEQRIPQLGPVSENLFWIVPEQFRSRDESMPDLASIEGQELIDNIIERQKIELVVLDNISTLVRTGEENAAEAWAPIQQWALRQRWAGRSVIFIAHEGATGSGRPRGSSKREDVLDTMIGLTEDKDSSSKGESVFELKFTKSRSFYGENAAQRTIRLSTESGSAEWSSEVVKSQADRAKELKEKGYTQKQIAEELGVSQPCVSKWLKS
jgi:putative DNA primase/helicase